jgi:hypothetical protein
MLTANLFAEGIISFQVNEQVYRNPVVVQGLKKLLRSRRKSKFSIKHLLG